MKKHINIFRFLILILGLINTIKSYGLPGDFILEVCQSVVDAGDYSAEIRNSQRCIDYMVGMTDGLNLSSTKQPIFCENNIMKDEEYWKHYANYQKTLGICLPDSTTLFSLDNSKKNNVENIKIFYNYISGNLKDSVYPASELYVQAMRAKYPCDTRDD